MSAPAFSALYTDGTELRGEDLTVRKMQTMALGDLPDDLCTKAGQRKQKGHRQYFLRDFVAPGWEPRKIEAISR